MSESGKEITSPTPEQIAAFSELFQGNPSNHYVRQDGAYVAVEGGIGAADVARHLSGESPSLLSIPIDRDARSHFAVVDFDRHGEADPAIDHAVWARRVTELKLPLIIFQSKGLKGAWAVCFFKGSGVLASVAKQLMEYYAKQLDLPGEREIFPKQTSLEPSQKGSGVNLGYFGSTRPAFGKAGEVLSLDGFISLARERQSFGELLVRDAGLDATASGTTPSTEEDHPMTMTHIRAIHAKNLADLRAMPPNTGRNDALNVLSFFAARAFAAGALAGTEAEIKNCIKKAALASGLKDDEITTTGGSGWRSGVVRPVQILDPVRAHDEALVRIDAWLADEKMEMECEEALSALALLTEEEYESLERRRKAAKRLGISKPAKLDEFVKKRRPSQQPQEQDSGIIVDDVKAWHERVDGAALLESLAGTVRRFVIFQRPSDADAIALWLIATYCSEKFNILPYLGVTAPTSECGKTTVMKSLLYLCWRPVQSSNVSGPVVYRVIELYNPTLLVDEVDSFLNNERNSELVGIFNAGHEREFAYVLRCVGEDSTPTRFNCFGPKAFGMIGRPPDTLLSRSIIIRLVRKDVKDVTEDLDARENPALLEEFSALRRKIKRWVEDNSDAIASATPQATGIGNRARDNWRSLFKIASVAGTEWTEKALAAAGAPSIKRKENELIRALRDARNIFHTRNTDRIPSRILVQDFLRHAPSGWNRFHNERDELDERGLAGLLGEFEWHTKPAKINEQQRQLFGCKELERCYVLDDRIRGLFEKFLDGEPETVEVTTESFGPEA